MSHQVLLFYKYVTVDDPAALADWFRARCQYFNLKGRALIATEGINATLEGTVEHTESFVSELKADPRFADVHIKRSEGNGESFPKLSVKVRNEIVGTQFPTEVDPRVKTATHLSASQLREWYENKEDFVVVDMRNSYEYASGHFEGSIDPGMVNSRDLPDKMDVLEPIKDKKIVTVCTGGIRCEKMSAYLLYKGFKDVYQLDGGIHTYMEQYPGKDFKGTLYTFDQRVTMDFGGDRQTVGSCHLCGNTTENYINCGNDICHLHFLVCTTCLESSERTYCSDECRAQWDTVNA